MVSFVNNFEFLQKAEIEQRIIIDMLQTISHRATRNRLAAGIAFVSSILFLTSGYKANLAVLDLIIERINLHTAEDICRYMIIPVGFLVIPSQSGGFTVLMCEGLFAANRVNLGKFLVMRGTGQGLFSI